MTLVELIVYLVIAGICGAIARALAGGTGGGFAISLLVGFLGTWLARRLNLPAVFVVAIDGHRFPIVWSIVGGIVLVGVAHVLMRPRYGGRYAR